MKKIIIFLGLLFAIPASASLWQYYQERGLELPIFKERIQIADSCGIENYRGTIEQNNQLEVCIDEET